MGEEAGCEGAMTITQGCVATNNTAETMAVSGANAVVKGSTVGAVTISAKNVTFKDNTLSDLLTVSSSENTIQNNIIKSASTYAVDLKTSSNNTVTDNILYGNELVSDAAVNFVEGKDNIVKDNLPVDPELVVSVIDISV